VLTALGKPAADIIARAKGAEGEQLVKEATDAARKLGIFGAPTFAIGDEIFWGDDRLEEALSFASAR
jgi:2-hydroxychromene-2-carboxylate isomerase